MRFLRWIAYVLIGLVGLIALLFVVGRFSDGPIAIIPGGPLESGELVGDANVDWSFARDISEIEMQLADESRSRTVWIGVVDGKAYIPCSLDFPPFKSWHHRAVEDGRAIIRIDGKRYRRTLVRADDEAERQKIGAVIGDKYGADAPTGNIDRVWFFRLDP